METGGCWDKFIGWPSLKERHFIMSHGPMESPGSAWRTIAGDWSSEEIRRGFAGADDVVPLSPAGNNREMCRLILDSF